MWSKPVAAGKKGAAEKKRKGNAHNDLIGNGGDDI